MRDAFDRSADLSREMAELFEGHPQIRGDCDDLAVPQQKRR